MSVTSPTLNPVPGLLALPVVLPELAEVLPEVLPELAGVVLLLLPHAAKPKISAALEIATRLRAPILMLTTSPF
jgi:hypothetical protein